MPMADMAPAGCGDPLSSQGQTSDKGQTQYLRYASLSNAGFSPKP